MELFIDSANLSEIKEISQWGILTGVTTNPSLIAKEQGVDFEKVIKEICGLVDGPISAEVTAQDAQGMIVEAKEISKWHKNIVIKIPINAEGLKAISVLEKANIKTNATLCFSANQGLLVARVGASFVSPFVGRLDDIGHDGIQVVEEIAAILGSYGYKTKIISASIRNPQHVAKSAFAGADIATVPYKVLKQMLSHPLTDFGIEQFLKDWKKVKK